MNLKEPQRSTTTDGLIEFPVKAARGQPELWAIGESGIREFEAAFPEVDVRAEVRRARSWCLSNPDRRKTARGMARFLHSWLSNSAKDGGKRPVAQEAKSRSEAQRRREALAASRTWSVEEWAGGFMPATTDTSIEDTSLDRSSKIGR